MDTSRRLVHVKRPRGPSLQGVHGTSLPNEQEGLQEYARAGLIHKCPRILAVGVLLLEIGLARPMEGCHHPEPNDRYFVRKTNEDYASATAGTQAAAILLRDVQPSKRRSLNRLVYWPAHFLPGDRPISQGEMRRLEVLPQPRRQYKWRNFPRPRWPRFTQGQLSTPRNGLNICESLVAISTKLSDP